MTINNGNEILTAAQAAKLVGLSVNRFREIARAGDIKFYRPKGRRKMAFKAKDIASYLGCKVEEL